MSVQADLKATHLRHEAERWDDAVGKVRELLRSRSRIVREVTHRFFTVSSSTRFSVFGGAEYGHGIKLHGYVNQMAYSPVALMEFIQFFVNHELLDDGEPGVGYYRSTLGDQKRLGEWLVRCSKAHPKAQPYFHRSTEVLREEGYDEDYETLTPERALEILDWYEERRVKSQQILRRRKHGIFRSKVNGQMHLICENDEEEDVIVPDLTDEEKALGALVNEIM